MTSVMATESEVCGSCAGKINVSIELENRGAWLCCGWDYFGFILAGKVAEDWRWRRAMVPGIGGRLGLLEGD